MPEQITPYKKTSDSKAQQVEKMFDNIASRYDFMNQLLSLGIHKSWRKKSIKLLQAYKPQIILDIATGTADFALEAMRLKPKKVIGIDISEGMMKIGREKIKQLNLQQIIELQKADSENLPFADNFFDAITVGFGVRNFEHLSIGLENMYRVLKPNGVALILEFSKPKTFPIKQLYNFYFLKICPLMGKLFTKDQSAYTYLPESVAAFPDGNEFLSIMQKAGFEHTNFRTLAFGIASIYTGKK